MPEIRKNDVVYYTRIIPTSNIFDVLEFKVRTVADDWFVGVEKIDKQAFLFGKKSIGDTIFFDRDEALSKVIEEENINKKSYDQTWDFYIEEE